MLKKKYEINDNTKTFHTNVVGVTFTTDNVNRQVLLKKINNKDELLLLEGIFNGEKTIEVLTKKGKKIGNISKEFKDEVLSLLNDNRIKKIEAKKVGEDKDILGISLTIYYE